MGERERSEITEKYAGKSQFLAVCPDCEQHRDLETIPIPHDYWPECRQCWQPMNIYERTTHD